MGRSVLVVDDLVFYRHRIRNLLRRLGYVVYEASEGEEACRIALGARPDAVLLDQVMIGLSGFETLRRLRDEGYEGSVIVLSPRPDAPEARAFLREGARSLLPKAVSASRIEAELREAFDQASAALSVTPDSASRRTAFSGNVVAFHPEEATVHASLRRAAIAAGLIVLAASSASAAGLDYRMDVRRDGGDPVVHVDAALSRYTGHAVRIVLATPPIAAETYFRFFDGVTFTGADGEPLAADPEAPGVYHLPAVEGDVRVQYRVHVGDLGRAEGSGHRLPAVDGSGAVLPLRALLAIPEADDGREVPIGTLAVTVSDGDRPLATPWETMDGRAEFSAGQAPDVVRSAIVVTGEADVVDGRDQNVAAYVVVRGGDEAAAARASDVVFRLVEHYAKTFGFAGREPLTVVWELGAGEPDAIGSGAFLRARSPVSYLSATPGELSYGSDAYAFYRALAHETFHRWIGTEGIARPGGPEVFWFSEGAAEYLGTIALARVGLAEPATVTDALADRAAKVRAHPERARAIDGDESVYASSRAYRDILVLKAPLVCFLLDTQMIEQDPERGLEAVAQGLMLSAFMRSGVRAPIFRTKDLVQKTEALLGPQGPAAMTTYVSGAPGPLLAPRAKVVGVDWREGRNGVPEASIVEGGAFARRLAVDVAAP